MRPIRVMAAVYYGMRARGAGRLPQRFPKSYHLIDFSIASFLALFISESPK